MFSFNIKTGYAFSLKVSYLTCFLCMSCFCSNAFCNDNETKASKKPNVVIFFIDDLGYKDLGCYGSPDIKTPHIDRMAEEGMKFTSFYAQTVCGPSRAALLTGCYRHGFSDGMLSSYCH